MLCRHNFLLILQFFFFFFPLRGFNIFCLVFAITKTKGVQQQSIPDPPSQPIRSGPKTDRPDVGDGQWRVSASRIRKPWVGWQVFSPKPEET